MEKLGISLLASLALGSFLVGGIYLHQGVGETGRSCREMSGKVAGLQEDLRAAREEIRTLAEELRSAGTVPAAPAAGAGVAEAADPPVPAAAGDPAGPVPAVHRAEVKTVVLAALDEERKQRDEARKKEREDARKRSEARREEMAALAEGPYDRFNVKVNSLAKVLGLNEAQKQGYYELSKQAADKLQEGRKAAAPAAGAGADGGQRPPGGRGGPGGPGGPGGDRGAMRQLYDTTQKEFAAAVQGMLSPAQLEVYNNLPEPSRSFRSMSVVAVPGEGGAGGIAGQPPPGGPFRGKTAAAPRGGRR